MVSGEGLTPIGQHADEQPVREVWLHLLLGRIAYDAMTHIAINEALDGKVADWMEKVSDEQYRAGSRAE